MALKGTVSGTGKLIAQQIGEVSYTYTRTELDETGAESVTSHTVTHPVVRSTYKWYALTEGAVTAYVNANPSFTLYPICTNEIINSWELTREVEARPTYSHATATMTEK